MTTRPVRQRTSGAAVFRPEGWGCLALRGTGLPTPWGWRFCRPYGTWLHFLGTYPGLTSWAVIFRPNGARVWGRWPALIVFELAGAITLRVPHPSRSLRRVGIDALKFPRSAFRTSDKDLRLSVQIYAPYCDIRHIFRSLRYRTIRLPRSGVRVQPRARALGK
jgi:hypothetical protein